jgi:hypothetical protein
VSVEASRIYCEKVRGKELNELLHETRLQKLEDGHDMLSRDYSRLNDAIVKISDSLTALVVIQEQNKTIMQHIERNSTLIEKSSSRIDEIERHQPQLLELRNWVLTGLGLIISAVVVAMIALVVK